MAELTGCKTLIDFAKETNDKKTMKIVEMLAKTNEIISDLLLVSANSGDVHKTTQRVALPTVSSRRINRGTVPSNATNKQITATCEIMESLGQLDEEFLNRFADPAGARITENSAHMEAMNQEMATRLFYGDSEANPDQFTGLSKYYSSTTGETGDNIILGGSASGQTDNTSLWLIVWDELTCHGFFPMNSNAGIYHEDKGKERVSDGRDPQGFYYAWVDQFKWRLGLALRDYRYVVRIPNIDVSLLDTAGDTSDTSANLMKLMIKAMNTVPSLQTGRAAFYCNKTVKTAFDIKALDKVSGGSLTTKEIADGKFVTSFLGVPIRRCDNILNTESRIS
jgi:hypothetical protein